MVSRPDLSDAYPEDLLNELQDGLATLADIDVEFDQVLGRLERWACSEAERAEVRNVFHEWRESKRQPHLQRVALIHHRMLRRTLLRGLNKPLLHPEADIGRT
jgi:hypothetical protein